MKKLIATLFGFVLISTNIHVYPEKLAELSENYRLPNLIMDKDLFYVIGGYNMKVDIYSRGDFKYLTSFGKLGEGPGEFKSRIMFSILPDKLCVYSRGKVSYFTKSGELLNEVSISPHLSRVVPVGKSLAGIENIYDQSKGTMKTTTTVKVFNPNEGWTKDILQWKSEVSTTYSADKKQNFLVFFSDGRVRSNGLYLYVGYPDRGLYFKVYDEKGKLVRDINYSYPKTPVTKKDKREFFKKYRKIMGETGYKANHKAWNFVFPKFFPPYKFYYIKGNKIYAKTDRFVSDRRITLILDLDERTIQETTVPGDLDAPFTFYEGKIYMLIDNLDTSTWELHVEEIE